MQVSCVTVLADSCWKFYLSLNFKSFSLFTKVFCVIYCFVCICNLGVIENEGYPQCISENEIKVE